MKIKMTGIDYSTAGLNQREIFAFTSSQAQQAMQNIVQNYGLNGVVLLTTCNRTELWISEKDEQNYDLPEILCDLKQVKLDEYKTLFKTREGLEAIYHLLETAAGLKSQIWGEDQILTQVKAAIESARNVQTTDQVLEKLFQTAITAGKKIKTKVRLTTADVSMPAQALEIMKDHFSSLKGLKCLVIGNGEMGRMVAAMLRYNNAEVTVTKRKYKNGTCLVPEGCAEVQYENRTEKIKEADIIVSATSSPHYTLKLDDVKAILKDNKQRLMIDMAVPRDIDPVLSMLPNLTLIDSDRMGRSSTAEVNSDSLLLAREIIDEYVAEFLKWVKARALFPVIDRIALTTSDKIKESLAREIQNLNLEQQEKILFEQKLAGVTVKAIQSILYSMKANIGEDQWEACFGKLHASGGE